MAKIINPLAFNVPIVDPKTGYPTEYFKRILEDISDAKISASLIEALGGDPDEDQVVTWDDTAGDLAFKPASDVLDMIGSEAHGDILYRDSAAWSLLPAGTDGNVLTTHGAGADPTWETPSGGGGGGTWQLLGGSFASPGIWDQSVDGTLGTIDFTGLDGATDIRIVMDQVTKSVSTAPGFRVSVDNGASFFAGSNYAFCDVNGVRSTNSFMGQGHLTNATAARDSIFEIRNANVGPAVGINVTANVSHRIFTGSTSPINAVRIIGLSACNFTGGKFYCFARL